MSGFFAWRISAGVIGLRDIIDFAFYLYYFLEVFTQLYKKLICSPQSRVLWQTKLPLRKRVYVYVPKSITHIYFQHNFDCRSEIFFLHDNVYFILIISSLRIKSMNRDIKLLKHVDTFYSLVVLGSEEAYEIGGTLTVSYNYDLLPGVFLPFLLWFHTICIVTLQTESKCVSSRQTKSSEHSHFK